MLGQQSKPTQSTKTYTTKEFFDSLYWELEGGSVAREDDGDYDGFLTIVSSIDGSSTKIPLDGILSKNPYYISRAELLEWVEKQQTDKVTFPQGADMKMPYNQMLIGYNQALSDLLEFLNPK